jgi:glycosyltransferase involved in cell wall biosynthesis
VENLMLPVSVIIPTHNSAETIERAINSVLAQTVLPAEIVVVDDCSTDNTVELVRTISTPDTVVLKIVQLEANLGPSATRNAGWDVAGCEFVAFLDSDDSWHPMKLGVQTNWMINNPKIRFTGHLTGDAQGFVPPELPPIHEFQLKHFLIRNRVSTPTVMIRREVSSRFDPQLWFAEDYELWLRLLSGGESMVRIEIPLAQLHKADFGVSGLSSKLYPMYRGELKALSNLKSLRHLSTSTLTLVSIWMTFKFALRILRTQLRKFA